MSNKTKDTKLSIIIPAYNAQPYLGELLDCLSPQMTKDVECIIIDDGSRDPVKTDYKWAKVIRQENRGVASARNRGLDKAKGDYIQFIDADDLVAKDFVEKILKTAADEPDVIEHSWKSLTNDGWKIDSRLMSEADRLTNPSACTRCFKRAFIGETRFNEQKDSTEDEDFCRKMGYLDPETPFKRAVITDYMYFYRDNLPMSKNKRYAAGLMNTKRVVYFYKHVSADMTWLLDEIKEQDKTNEVFLLTYQNDIKELKRYCQIKQPQPFWGHIVKGEPYSGLTERKPPLRTQIVIYRKIIPVIGGLGTFIEHFINTFSELYDITICCEMIEDQRYKTYSRKVRVLTNQISNNNQRRHVNKFLEKVHCDTLIMLSILDPLPTNIHSSKIVRMCHTCKTDPQWSIPKDYDELIFASETSKKSFDFTDGKVIHNLNIVPKDKGLLLVSATRFPAPDKGKIEQRMRTLANMLNDKGIPFLWLNFSNGPLPDPPKHFINMGVSHDMQSIIKTATYVVALSDSECWSYTCLEALMNNVPLICTPFPSVFEMGVKDGVNAHVLPFDMKYDVTNLLNVPKFNYEYDNEKIKEDWIEILGHKPPRHDYVPEQFVEVEILKEFRDVETNEMNLKGQKLTVTKARAEEMLHNLGTSYIKVRG